MAHAVRAVYEQGWLRLLDPVNLIEGQEIHVMLVSERERARAVLDDLLVQYEPEPVEEIDETKLLAEIDAAMQGKPPISDAIIEERREGP
jgi:predicted DNA-binding antitoxin AbrB/MazE fold protein